MIHVNNLHKYFGENEVLKGVNDHIKKGEVVVVIGPSGSGKSTFLRCLNGLEERSDGSIYLEGYGEVGGEIPFEKMYFEAQ